MPARAIEGERHGLDGLLGWMHDDAAGVGTLVLGNQRLLAGLEIDRSEGAGVAVSAVDEVKNVAALVEAARTGGEAIGHGRLDEIDPAAFAVGLDQECAAVLREFLAKRNLEVVVGQEAGEIVILLDQFPIAGLRFTR